MSHSAQVIRDQIKNLNPDTEFANPDIAKVGALLEIAAQLAELNATLNRICPPPVPRDPKPRDPDMPF